VIADIEPMPN